MLIGVGMEDLSKGLMLEFQISQWPLLM